MKYIKGLLLSLLILPSLVTPILAKDPVFSDVPFESKFYDFIEQVSEEEIVNGYSDGTFKPQQPITRGQFAKIMYKALYLPKRTDCEEFKDVDDTHVFYEYITTLKCLGFINGYADGRFGPDDKITRAQTAKILYFIGKIVDPKNFPLTRNLQVFEDVDFDNNMFWYIDPVVSVKLDDGSRVMNGYSNGKFGPDDNISREQVSKVIINFRAYIVDGGSYSPSKTMFYNLFTDEVVEGSVTEDAEYTINGEYNVLQKLNKSIIEKNDSFSAEEFEKHKAIWESFQGVVPKKLSGMVNKMVLIDDHESISAAVTRNFSGDQDKFVLIVNEKSLDEGKMTSWNSIHESAHILTLNNSQVKINPNLYKSYTQEEFNRILDNDKKDCNTIFVLSGCANNGSYIYEFYNKFWIDKDSEYDAVRESQSEELRKQFYLKYNDQFVSAYAMFGLEEDIAESFLYFVLFEKPEDNDSIINQKINFFYKYSDLVKLRKEIRENLD